MQLNDLVPRVPRCGVLHQESLLPCALPRGHEGPHGVSANDRTHYTRESSVGPVEKVEKTTQRFDHRLYDDVNWHAVKTFIETRELEGYELVALSVAHSPVIGREYYVVAMKRPVS